MAKIGTADVLIFSQRSVCRSDSLRWGRPPRYSCASFLDQDAVQTVALGRVVGEKVLLTATDVLGLKVLRVLLETSLSSSSIRRSRIISRS